MGGGGYRRCTVRAERKVGTGVEAAMISAQQLDSERSSIGNLYVLERRQYGAGIVPVVWLIYQVSITEDHSK